MMKTAKGKNEVKVNIEKKRGEMKSIRKSDGERDEGKAGKIERLNQ